MNNKITDLKLYSNRVKWINYLKSDSIGKHQNELEDLNEPKNRCCIGHAFHCLGFEREEIDGVYYYDGELLSASDNLINLLGLKGSEGEFFGDEYENFNAYKEILIGVSRVSLVILNDYTDLTPQDIGALLEPMIMGGDGTPFTKITIE
jgi:hypothetical protein